MFMVLHSGFVLVDTVCVICCYETAVLRTDLTPELSWNERFTNDLHLLGNDRAGRGSAQSALACSLKHNQASARASLQSHNHL